MRHLKLAVFFCIALGLVNGFLVHHGAYSSRNSLTSLTRKKRGLNYNFMQLSAADASYTGAIEESVELVSPASLEESVELVPPAPAESSVDVDDGEKKKRSFVAIFNPTGFEISVEEPFGDTVKSVAAAEKELVNIVTGGTGEELYQSDFLKCRVEYLVKVLSSSYIPSFTLEFMELVHSGTWEHAYSNVLTHGMRKDAGERCIYPTEAAFSLV